MLDTAAKRRADRAQKPSTPFGMSHCRRRPYWLRRMSPWISRFRLLDTPSMVREVSMPIAPSLNDAAVVFYALEGMAQDEGFNGEPTPGYYEQAFRQLERLVMDLIPEEE